MASLHRPLTLTCVCLLLCLLGIAVAALAQAPEQPVSIDIPAGDLADALDRLGEQSGTQIMYEPALAKGVRAPSISGALTVGDAMFKLLAGTGLQASRVNDRTVVLKRMILSGACRSLQDVHVSAEEIVLPTQGARVTSARPIAEDTVSVYCLAEGAIQSVDRQAQDIKFQMALPLHWNGNLVQLGGGGLDGRVVSPTEPNGIVAPIGLIARGYMVFGSDSGHEGTRDVSFTLNDEQMRNFGGEQLQKTLDVAVFLAKTLYGSTPRHRYFIGGSAGGRESFTAVQKFARDYDGVLSLYPANQLVPLTLKFLLVRRAMEEGGGGGRVGPTEAQMVERAELAACDKDDGVQDGIIANPRACHFDFASLRCPKRSTAGESCLSDAQVATLQLIHSRQVVDVSLADGSHTLPAFDIGTSSGAFYANTATVADFVRYLLLRDTNVEIASFNPLHPGRIRPRVEALSALYDRTSLDVDAFIAKGGKWIMVHGLADELVPSEGTIDYYNSIVAKFGHAKADDFLRLYLIPGYGHGHGAPFDASYGPFFEALESWVENGEPPQVLIVADRDPSGHGRSRPSCLYPALPRYKGSGSPDDTASFVCVTH
jgi:hypothetical protein